MLFWTLTFLFLAAAIVLCSIGRLIRQWAYHAGHGFGLGQINTPRLLHSIPWPLVWLTGILSTLIGCGFVVLSPSLNPRPLAVRPEELRSDPACTPASEVIGSPSGKAP